MNSKFQRLLVKQTKGKDYNVCPFNKDKQYISLRRNDINHDTLIIDHYNVFNIINELVENNKNILSKEEIIYYYILANSCDITNDHTEAVFTEPYVEFVPKSKVQEALEKLGCECYSRHFKDDAGYTHNDVLSAKRIIDRNSRCLTANDIFVDILKTLNLDELSKEELIKINMIAINKAIIARQYKNEDHYTFYTVPYYEEY